MLNATVIPVTAFAQNCSVVWCERTRSGAVIDPGGDLDQVLAAARENEVRLEKILLTHAHIDHAGGTAELARSLQLTAYDAAYVALAARLGLPLATADERLIAACSVAGVAVVE